jgi:hypothetical protein
MLLFLLSGPDQQVSEAFVKVKRKEKELGAQPHVFDIPISDRVLRKLF